MFPQYPVIDSCVRRSRHKTPEQPTTLENGVGEESAQVNKMLLWKKLIAFQRVWPVREGLVIR
jgi:hypothetical protein